MTLKEIWEKLEKPEQFVAKLGLSRLRICRYKDKQLQYNDKMLGRYNNCTDNFWSIPSLTLAKCHEWAKKVQGGDGFPFHVYNIHDQRKSLICGISALVKWPDAEYTYFQPATTSSLEQVYKEVSGTLEKTESPCGCKSLLNGHLNGCPDQGLWEKNNT